MSYKQPYFCPNCKKIMRPLDSEMYRKIGMCLDCEANFETLLLIKKNKNKIILFDLIKKSNNELFFDNEELAVNIMQLLQSSEELDDDNLQKFIVENNYSGDVS